MTGALLALGVCLQPLTAQDAPSGNAGQGQGRGQGGGGGGGGGRQRGNFDPEQMRQQIMTRYREQLGIKDDAEWGVIEGRINKINEARRNSGRGFGGFGGFGGEVRRVRFPAGAMRAFASTPAVNPSSSSC